MKDCFVTQFVSLSVNLANNDTFILAIEVQIINWTNTCTVVELTADSGAMLEAAIFLKVRSFQSFFRPE